MALIPRTFPHLSKGLKREERDTRNGPELAEHQIVDSCTFSRSGVLWAPVS
jgi:hypothetical protein